MLPGGTRTGHDGDMSPPSTSTDIAGSRAERRVAFVGGSVYADDQIAGGRALLVADGRIEAVVRTGEIPAEYARSEFGPGLLVPGFVDIHAHGAAGAGFHEADPAAWRKALTAFADAGVTTVLPTLASAPIDRLLAAVSTYRTVADNTRTWPGRGDDTDSHPDPPLPHLPGVHLEGPYFSPVQRGAQDPDALRVPSDGSVGRLLEYAGALRIVSFAPELPGAVALTKRLVSLGVVAAAGHSNARDTDLIACQRVGLTHVIHVVSGQSTTIREGPWRRPGLLEATLASDGLTVEMIGDGKHLPATLMKLVLRCLPGRVCLVSDATPGAGLPEGAHYRLGDRTYIVEGGVGVTLDRTAFAGSTTLVAAMLPLLVTALGTPVTDALAMLTSIPAKAAGLTDVGRIAPGYRADFVVLDGNLAPREVIIGGVRRASARLDGAVAVHETPKE